MHLNIKHKWLLAIVLIVWSSMGFALGPTKPVPPRFSLENDSAEVLRGYPLGIISEQDAFGHHGSPLRKIRFPNDNQGWLYKTGEYYGVPSIYILQFSNEGFVIDVLHKDYRYKNGHSALQYQLLEKMDVLTRLYGPGPGE